MPLPGVGIYFAFSIKGEPQQRIDMGVCSVCKNYYDKTFFVTMESKLHEFDSFECAIHALAPKCHHCGVRILGHGTEVVGKIFCSGHCAKAEGHTGIHDRSPDPDLYYK